jgi:hypothetical protein
VSGSCEHGDEPSGSIKFKKFLHKLSVLIASQEGLCSMELVTVAQLVKKLPGTYETLSRLLPDEPSPPHLSFMLILSSHAHYLTVSHVLAPTGPEVRLFYSRRAPSWLLAFLSVCDPTSFRSVGGCFYLCTREASPTYREGCCDGLLSSLLPQVN